MNSATDEVLAQFLFLTGLGCFPLAIALALVGMVCKSPEISLPCFSLAAVAFTHFLWYFNYLSIALADKVGTAVLPAWYSFLPYSLIGFLGLLGVWMLLHRRQRPPKPRARQRLLSPDHD